MGLLADLIGGAASTGQRIVQDDIKAERQRVDDERQSELAMKRAKELEEYKQATVERLRREKEQRTAQQLDAAEQGGEKRTAARELLSAQSNAPSVDEKTLGLIKSKLSPQQLEKVYGVKTTALDRIDDQISEARKNGSYDALEVLKDARKQTVESMKQELAERKQASQEALGQQRADNDTKRTEALLLKASRDSGKTDGGNGKLTESERKTYTALMQDTTRQLLAAQRSLPDIMGKTQKQAVLDNIETLKEQHRIYSSLLAESQGSKSAKSEPPKADGAKPSGVLKYNPKTGKFE